MSDLDAIWAALPPLVDRPTLAKQIGLKRHDLDRIFDRCTVHRVGTKPYVLRDEARACIVSEAPAPRRRAA